MASFAMKNAFHVTVPVTAFAREISIPRTSLALPGISLPIPRISSPIPPISSPILGIRSPIGGISSPIPRLVVPLKAAAKSFFVHGSHAPMLKIEFFLDEEVVDEDLVITDLTELGIFRIMVADVKVSEKQEGGFQVDKDGFMSKIKIEILVNTMEKAQAIMELPWVAAATILKVAEVELDNFHLYYCGT